MILRPLIPFMMNASKNTKTIFSVLEGAELLDPLVGFDLCDRGLVRSDALSAEAKGCSSSDSVRVYIVQMLLSTSTYTTAYQSALRLPVSAVIDNSLVEHLPFEGNYLQIIICFAASSKGE